MLEIIFTVLVLLFMFRVIRIAVRASWGLLSVLLFIVFFPGLLMSLAFAGMIILALPLLLIGGTVALFTPA
ncbi:MAG: hypothetical protein K5771_00545 [Oscillospiraceae bacterium]|nr:hypothetical protein [Oscillospiraceae bacterium]